MTITLSALCIPLFSQTLAALSANLEKAEAYATARGFDPKLLLDTRLFPDMYPLSQQIRIACDFAKNTSARLADLELPVFADDERTFADFRARIDKTLAFVAAIDPHDIDRAVGRTIELKIGGRPTTFEALPYLTGFAIPNMLFHATTAYALLRHCGVPLGKRDFLGAIPAL